MLKINNIEFSITDKIIVGLPISQNIGRNRAVKIAKGATPTIPSIESSICYLEFYPYGILRP